MTDFADVLGRGYMNLVVRRIAQKIADAGDAYLTQTGASLSARSTSALAVIARGEGVTVSEISRALGYSHQAVAKSVAAMERAGLVSSQACPQDNRKRILSLTAAGQAEADVVQQLAEAAEIALGEAFAEIGVDLFEAMRAFEHALDRRPLGGRLLDAAERLKDIGETPPAKT